MNAKCPRCGGENTRLLTIEVLPGVPGYYPGARKMIQCEDCKMIYWWNKEDSNNEDV